MELIVTARRLLRDGRAPALSALALGLALTGCGSATTAENGAVSGIVSADNLTSATVNLTDASGTERTLAVDASGAFTIDVNGLTPPYLLSAEAQTAAGTERLLAIAQDSGVTNLNALTTVGVRGAVDDDAGDAVRGYQSRDDEGRRRAATSFQSLMQQLQTALKPLFDLYGVPANPFTTEGADASLRAMMRDVSFSVKAGTLVVTNRATGGVIFSGPLSNPSSGTFNEANLPGGTGGATGCTAFTYGPWAPSVCPDSGQQTRTVASATPAGCTGGSPVLTQACTPPPPAPVACTSFSYGPWAPATCPASGQQTRTVASSLPAGCTGGSPVLTQACTPAPASCTSFTYSAWAPATCPASGQQTRTVLVATPTGCTGGSPVLTQNCTPPPPTPATCTSFTYSSWAPATCPASGQQTRTVASSLPAGCTGGSPVLTQACTPPPPTPATCSSFTYNAWSTCSASGQQTRTVASSLPAGCTGGSPVLTQACTPPPAACTSFTYSAWGSCSASGQQTRTVVSSLPAGCTGGAPVLTQACTPPPAACTSFTYSAWSTCSASGQQTRTVASSLPAGCTGGSPVLTQACTPPAPAPDGVALYGSKCAGCHGSLASSDLKGKGLSVSMIKSAGMTKGLTDAELQAVVNAVGP